MWYKLASNPEVVESIYGAEIPIIKGVLLHEIEFRLDGGSIILLRFGPPNYPLNPPEKWVSRGNDTTGISLQLIDVMSTSLERKGILPKTFCDFSFEQEDENLLLEIRGDDIHIRVRFRQLYIDGVVAYRGRKGIEEAA